MSRSKSNLRSGGQVLVDQLRVHGTSHVFCVPGESYLAALEAFNDAPEIDLIVCRQEGGAAMMAEACGKLSGAPGIAFVTRGPGATNASAGLHVAFQDSTPMILFVGQVPRAHAEREAFQEIDFRRMFGQLAKWVGQIDDAARIPEYVSRAFHTAVNGRPGPVVLALPEDMLRDMVSVEDARRYRESQSAPAPEALQELRERLAAAKRPLAILGGGGWDAAAVAHIEEFARRFDLPVGTSFRAQSHFNNELDQYAGDIGIGINPALAEKVKEADLVLAIGARLGELTTSGYTLLEPPRPKQDLIHVHPDPEELGRVYEPDLPVVSGMKPFAAAMAELEEPAEIPWGAWRAGLQTIYRDWNRPEPVPGDVQLGEVIAWLRERLPDDAIVANGAGNYNTWLHKNFRYRQYRTQLGPTSGSMGYGTPAAIAAKLLYPDRMVVNWAGDGCFMMHGQELATAVHHGANVVFIVVNNGMYGTIRMHLEKHYPGRNIGTAFTNPDFAALAESYGATGATVERTADFGPAFEAALEAGRPALIDLRIDPEAITPRQSLSQISEAARKR